MHYSGVANKNDTGCILKICAKNGNALFIFGPRLFTCFVASGSVWGESQHSTDFSEVRMRFTNSKAKYHS
jgi:hypothetical protein